MLNWDDPTIVAQPFSGYKRGFTDSNRANPCHNRCKPWRYRSSSGLYRPNTGTYRGVFIAHGLSWWRHGRYRRRPGLPRYLTAFPVTPGFKHFKHFRTTGDISRCNTVDPGSPRFPRCCLDCDTVLHGSSRIAKPG